MKSALGDLLQTLLRTLLLRQCGIDARKGSRYLAAYREDKQYRSRDNQRQPNPNFNDFRSLFLFNELKNAGHLVTPFLTIVNLALILSRLFNLSKAR